MNLRAYYNDTEPFVCEWTRNLMAAGHITQGTVDERSVTELTAADLAGHERVHLFSGLAGWEAALNLAGWHGPVWSASLPCPAFSCAGKSAGFADPRGQLWLPVLRLIRECRPVCVVGEQVPAAIRHGWLDRIFTDLEAAGYACGACIVGAHSSGAPHRRQRIYWVANRTDDGRREGCANGRGSVSGSKPEEERLRPLHGSAVDGLADSQHAERRSLRIDRPDGRDGQDGGRQEAHGELGTCGEVRDVADTGRTLGSAEHGHESRGRLGWGPSPYDGSGTGARSETDELGHAHDPRPQRRRIDAGEHARQQSAWAASQFISCADSKARRVPLEPAFQPLVDARDGARNRVGILRAAGNSICVPTAATFLRAVMDL